LGWDVWAPSLVGFTITLKTRTTSSEVLKRDSRQEGSENKIKNIKAVRLSSVQYNLLIKNRVDILLR